MKSGTKQKLRQFSFEAIGTQWHIEYSPGSTNDIEHTIRNRIEVFDACYSRFRPDSLISHMASASGVFELPNDSIELFNFYDRLYEVTDGLVTPLVGTTLSDAGYDAKYSLRFKRKTVSPDYRAAIIRDGTKFTTNQPLSVDVGAAGKGYLVDLVSDVLRSNGVPSAIVDAGGDIAVYSKDDTAVNIALQHPTKQDEAIGLISLSGGSICGSSIYLRNWGSHHHIINPYTAESPQAVQAVWVQAESALQADGLSTALFFVSPEKLRRRFDFEYAIIHADDSLTYSTDFPATFFE